ncbi:putative nucleoside-diphosphate-sugar epimerase [Phyllosticta capitalensis]
MAPSVFVTGATGYIGGDALYAVSSKHPDWSFAALVRDDAKAQQVKAKYPNLRIVKGTLDDYDVIKEEASKADIVIHTADASDHEGAAKAIADGMASGHTKERPGYWLHTGGTGILTFADSDAERYGEYDPKVYDDMEGQHELTNLPDHAFHRNVDKIVIEAGTKHADVVKSVIICPPCIYGPGRGPVWKRSRQVPTLVQKTLELKKAPIIGAGKSVWNNVHVHDLGDLFTLYADAAATHNHDAELWGPKGYVLAENGEHAWGDVAKAAAEAAAKAGYIPAPDTTSMSKDEAWEVADFQALSWGMNSRGKAIRAKKLLGWQPKAPSIWEEIPALVKREWESLQQK